MSRPRKPLMIEVRKCVLMTMTPLMLGVRGAWVFCLPLQVKRQFNQDLPSGHCSCLLQAHAVVLDMPAALCAEQAVGRQQHEGGVEGEEAARISHSVATRMRNEGPPAKAEGLCSVIVSCRNAA